MALSPSRRSASKAAAGDPGLVVAGHGRHVVVEAEGGRRVICHVRGKRNDCVVGDRVRWQPSGDEGVVDAIEPRDSLFYRQDAMRTKAFAANIDQLLVVIAVEPVFSEAQLARALVAASEAKVRARIVLNKRELPAFAEARTRLDPYAAMGVDVIEVSLKGEPEASQATLGPLLDGQKTLVLGPSGAGKSTLVNRMAPDAGAEVGELSQALRSGRHTTTSTRWHWLPGRHGALIDSPGFQSFGLFQIPPNELASHMPDLAAHVGGCRYYNCLHVAEPGCGVLAAAGRGEIAPTRLRIYREILDELAGSR